MIMERARKFGAQSRKTEVSKMKKSKIKTVAAGLLCLGLAGASSWAAETIESSAMGAGQMFDAAIPKAPLTEGQNGQAAQTLKGLKSIKASAGKLGLTLAKEKKAAAKCDVTVPGCQELMAVPEYKETSGGPSHGEGLMGGVSNGAAKGFFIGDFPVYIANIGASDWVSDTSNITYSDYLCSQIIGWPLGLIFLPLGIVGAIVGGIVGAIDPKAVVKNKN